MKTLKAFIPILVILAAPLAMLWPLWSNPVSAGEDDVVFYYPLRVLVAQDLSAGRLPDGNPLEAGGGPLMADPQAAVMHPTTWLFAAMDAKTAYALSIFIAFWAAGLGAYCYGRRLGLVRAAATLTAVAFMMCGFMVGHRVHLSMILSASMLPWLVLGIELLRTSRKRAFLIMCPALVLALAAGSWPTVIHMCIICSAYFLLRARPLAGAISTALAAGVLAAVIVAPQLAATAELMTHVTRQKLGYATGGENSFFPASIVLATFPMLLGSRTPNFFPAQWWGPWHLCESLGYVGLATLALAGAAIWTMYRKKPRGASAMPVRATSAEGILPSSCSNICCDEEDNAGKMPMPLHGPLVRCWTWIMIGAGIWMLGYYLPTYKLIQALPVLGVVRCPARMVLAVDLALAVLAGVAVHMAMSNAPAAERIRRAIRKAVLIVLPIAMTALLALVALFAWGVGWEAFWGFFSGGRQAAAQAAINPTNPAIWVQLAMLAATIVAVLAWLARPVARTAMLVIVLLADLFFVAHFVDMPAAGQVVPDPEVSPAAAWIRAHPLPGPWRVWGISKYYNLRPAELLLPKTCESLGISTITSYGPFQSPAHAQLLGFNISGYNRDWARLIRQNYLLTLYDVGYIVTSDRRYRDVIESVRVPMHAANPPDVGPGISPSAWKLYRGEMDGDTLRLRTPWMWELATADQSVWLDPATTHRIGLDARGPDAGAANFLRAEIVGLPADPTVPWEESALTIPAEQIGADWRHFEFKFQTPSVMSAPTERGAGEVTLRVLTMSERPIEVKNVEVFPCEQDRPVTLTGRYPLERGAPVYELAVELPALDPADPPVAIYRNAILVHTAQATTQPAASQPRPSTSAGPTMAQQIEQLKWRPWEAARPVIAPDVSLHAWPVPAWLWLATGGGLTLYVLAAIIWRRRDRTNAAGNRPAGGMMDEHGQHIPTSL